MNELCAALLAGIAVCASVLPLANAAAATETTLYSFCSQANCADGSHSPASLVAVNGTLYGTTSTGGANCPSGSGCGTLFSVDSATGAETVLHSFGGGGGNGSFPYANVIEVKGILYGTTSSGGAYGGGTVFAYDIAGGTESVVYAFCGTGFPVCTDGLGAAGGLIYSHHMLYGTTPYGGANCETQAGGGCGTVFAVNPATGAETVLYSFCNEANCADGSTPYAGLVDLGGMLYGTTVDGGANDRGTVFAIDPATGAESVVHSFCSQSDCADGAYPEAGLTAGRGRQRGILYGGTVEGGGASQCYPDGCGVIFALEPATGAENVLFSGWGAGSDLIDVKGSLYGTGAGGGTYDMGIVFAISTKTGAETTVYSFCSEQKDGHCTDGASPFAGVAYANGTLYGTTYYGGIYNQDFCYGGCGTVFALTNF